MEIHQQTVTLPEKKRGFHLITRELVSSLSWLHEIKTGVCHVFIQHTSASLCINENADATVRRDFEMYFNKAVRKMILIIYMIQKEVMICLRI